MSSLKNKKVSKKEKKEKDNKKDGNSNTNDTGKHQRKKLVNTKLNQFRVQIKEDLKKPVHGIVNFTMIGASDLAKADTFGLSDPYGVITATFLNKRYKTKIKKNTLNPRWNQNFEFPVHAKNATGVFIINLYDYDAGKKDDWLGMVSIPLYDVVTPPYMLHSWIPLETETKEKKKNKPQGKLFVKITFDPVAVKTGIITLANTAKIEKEDISEDVDEIESESGDGKAPPRITKSSKRFNLDEINKPDIGPPITKEGALPQSTRGQIVTKKDVEALYKFGKELGTGATAVVLQATSLQRKIEVAAKIVDKTQELDEFSIMAFQKEIEIIKMLSHENVVSAIEMIETKDEIYIFMELINGGDLFSHIESNENGFFPEKICGKFLYQMVTGIQYMHEKLICHRDIKPENILMSSPDTEKAVCKVSDFGASAFFTEKNPYMTEYIGTPMYMAPEVIQGPKYTKSCDIWSIGIVGYIILCGFPPFDADTDAELSKCIIEGDLDFPSPEWDEISFDARAFIMRLLQTETKSRMTLKEALKHPWLAQFGNK